MPDPKPLDEPYVPISCSLHDEMLAAATMRQACTLEVRAGSSGGRELRGVIEDVYASGGAEYLRLTGGATVRLDHIETFNGKPVPPA